MFYKLKVKDYIRIPPDKFDEELETAMIQQIKDKYEGHISQDLGSVIDVSTIGEIKDGVIIPGDGATYYETEFEIISFIPEMQEVVPGTIRDIADFGAFLTMGPSEGMIHISQTMNDYVSFSKDKALLGKESKKTLKVNDNCRARIISISYKDLSNPKIGLTMRQEGLGKEEWIQDDLEKPKSKKK
ncbi:DNA-directed RNA polymerase [Candidatus Woesearchaeota archaeon]|nr:DNA-directed RNA polymerase [Candidatus Woesearchaeota archaeon]MCF7901001.1 DNA-directed RNA polymerase [Candidatus Woesearchaeota archaeon]MCF8013283.1 DNA-directed RNA polymerase [Candidatus Woesearchaeota archaeon]